MIKTIPFLLNVAVMGWFCCSLCTQGDRRLPKFSYHFYCFALAVVHSHHGGTIFVHIKTIRFWDDGLIQYLRNMRNPIHTKVGHNAVFPVITYDIIEIVIPYERIRAQYIWDAIVT